MNNVGRQRMRCFITTTLLLPLVVDGVVNYVIRRSRVLKWTINAYGG